MPEPDPAARTEPFRFTVCAAEPGDILLLCGAGLAEPLRADPSFADRLAARWADPPALAGYPATLEDGAGEHEADRTAATVWEARGTAG
ncbi:hypothetical protein FM076_26555 [Streptomyces albus subsp. chlorinus]|nr:hypothetical protein [Streptomyces albus subsp. chlorinus]